MPAAGAAPDNIVGHAGGEGFLMADDWLYAGRVNLSAHCVGRAERIFGMACDWAANRKAFGRTVDEAEAKRRLASHGLAVPEGRALTRADLDALPETLEGPVVLKVLHEELPHKTEVGGVALNLDLRKRGGRGGCADRGNGARLIASRKIASQGWGRIPLRIVSAMVSAALS